MRLVTWDELTPSLETERIALTLAAFSGAIAPRTLERLRRRPGGTAEYVGVFAVERGHLLGEALVFRCPYRTVDGVTTVAGVANVTTRADASRRGIARAILEEAHRREREAGIEYALLWTSPSWGAHRLYESLGYRDLHTPSLAVRRLGTVPGGGPGESLRPAGAGALQALERLHAEANRGKPGFSVRAPGFLRTVRRPDRPIPGLMAYRRGGRLCGYALLLPERGQLRCPEIVARPRDLVPLLGAIERRAAPGLLAVGNTVVDRLRGRLRRRGYFVRARAEWRTLMGCPLGSRRSARAVRRALGVERPSFVCQGLDRF